MNDYPVWWSIIAIGCVLMLGLIVVAPGFILGFSLSRKFKQELEAEREERKKYKISIFENGGVVAPAVIISARKVKSWGGGKIPLPIHL